MKADLVVRHGTIVTPERSYSGGVAIRDGRIIAVGSDGTLPEARETIDATGLHVLPGLIDAHVHFRDPGLTHKEDFGTGSTAAVCGGITCVVDMPNVVPPTENAEQVQAKRAIAESKSLCDFGILGVIHQTNGADVLPMAEAGALGYKIFYGETVGNLPYPDDGQCIEIFPRIREAGIPLAVHCENRQMQHYWLTRMKAEGRGAPVDWESTRPAICEAAAVAHLLFLTETFGTRLHVVHVSSKQGAALVADAKKRGVRVTAETAPHYLLRDPQDMAHVGPLMKVNPPVRGRDHWEALWDGLRSGDIDMIATDHAPHTLEEKGCGLDGVMTKPAIWDCVSGFCGVETSVPLMLTQVNAGRLTLNQYVRAASEMPAKVWQMYPKKGAIAVGSDGDLTLVDMAKESVIDPLKLHSKNVPTPWGGWPVKGMPVMTIVRGHVQMRDGAPVGGVIGQMQIPQRP
jgi:dihydroorotase